MVLGVQLFQTLARHMSINLRGGNISMTQQQLHHAQIRAVIKHMRGKRMPQSMR